MIKIIKNGNTPSEIYIFECNVCGCVFEMNMADAKDCIELSPVYVRYSIGIYKCECPHCRNITAYGHRKEE